MSQQDAPGVDVVIATRDRPELLRVALRGVLEQEHPGPITVTVVFDQTAPDHGLAVDERDGDGNPRQVRVVANTRTPGLAGARNTGILAGSHELVAFCDDDDVWLPGKLAAQVPRLRSGALASVTGIEIDVAGTTRLRVPADGPIDPDASRRSRLTGAHPSSYLLRREALLGPVGLVDEELPHGYGEDYDLLLRLVEAGRVEVVGRPLVRVLWHQGSFFTGRWEAMDAGIGYLVRKHPALSRDRAGLGWLLGQRAFAQAAAGRRRDGVRTAGKVLRLDPLQPRAWLALAVAARVLPAETVMRRLNARGRGI